MSEEWAPSTNGVRGMYLLGLQGARKVWEGPIISPKEAEADFDRWLAKHDLETFDDGFAHGAEYGHVSQEMWPTH
jgi:hypothetical protein